jgi:hypothetical protein
VYKILNNVRADECPVKVEAGQVVLDGSLCIPPRVKGIVLFAHGSGSSRLSPRNKYVAQVLQKANIGTLLFDLLTREEELIDDRTAKYRFDIKLLAKRLIAATDWLRISGSENVKLGYFGASTGAAAADGSRNVRYGPGSCITGVARIWLLRLSEGKAATLLIVGGNIPKSLR